MYYKLSRLLLTPTSSKPSTTADVFISNPQIDQESILGKFFFVGEIDSNKPQALKIINFFTSYLEQTYYQNDKISLREKMGIIKISEIFENALTKTNAEFENFLKKEKIKISPKTLNLACGVIFKNELVFSSTGSIKALLVYLEQKNQDDFDDKKIYKIITLEDQGVADKKPNLNKIFANITEGKIPPEGYVVFMNEILPEYITNKHLTKIITTLPPVGAIEQIKNQLHKINSYVTFLALVIKSSTTPHVQRSIPKMNINITAHNSLEQMNETEDKTEKYLSPAGIIRINGLMRLLKNIFGKINFGVEKPSKTTIRDKIFFARKDRLRLFMRLKNIFKNLSNILVALIIYIVKALANPRRTIFATKYLSKRWLYNLKTLLIKSINWFIKLTVLSKSLLIIFILSATLFSYNIYHVTHEKNLLIAEQTYKETIEMITQKQNQINSSLLYKNEERVNELLKETANLISQLETYEKADKNLINDFKKENEVQVEKISHVINISNAMEVAQLKNLNNQTNPQGITILENNILVTSPNQSEVYSINTSNKAVSIVAHNSNVYLSVALNNKKALFVGDNGGLIIDAQNNTENVDVHLAKKISEIQDIKSYNERIYMLSSVSKEIIRFDKNYTTQTNWLKENLDISKAVGVAIDGYIYVLENNGKVIKLLSGYKNEFEISKINPPFTKPTKIKLTGDSEQGLIYILEPSEQRIAVFKKNGQFVLQYKIKNLTQIKDFAISEEKNKIFLLNDTAVYEIDMTLPSD